MKLIDKSALVAEMNKLKNISLEYGYTTEQRVIVDVGKDLTLRRLLDYIDTLKVKEMNIKKELSYEDYIKFFEEHPNFPDDWGFDEAWGFAKHFFELGISVSNKAQKEE